MQLNALYKQATKRHGTIGRDVVHDLFCKFGSDLPSDAYLTTCIQHTRPQPIQQRFEIPDSYEEDPDSSDFADKLKLLSVAVNNVRQCYELEVDTFLECHVNGSYKAFSESSGIARSVLEKICKFAKYEILKEFIRLEQLD